MGGGEGACACLDAVYEWWRGRLKLNCIELEFSLKAHILTPVDT